MHSGLHRGLVSAGRRVPVIRHRPPSATPAAGTTTLPAGKQSLTSPCAPVQPVDEPSRRLTSAVVRLQAMLWPPIPWPLPPVNGWNMVIDRHRGHTRVTVDAPLWKARAVSVRAYSSAIEGRALIADEWPDGLAGRIARRMADNHGGEKGRVLYIGRRTRAERARPARGCRMASARQRPVGAAPARCRPSRPRRTPGPGWSLRHIAACSPACHSRSCEARSPRRPTRLDYRR